MSNGTSELEKILEPGLIEDWNRTKTVVLAKIHYHRDRAEFLKIFSRGTVGVGLIVGTVGFALHSLPTFLTSVGILTANLVSNPIDEVAKHTSEVMALDPLYSTLIRSDPSAQFLRKARLDLMESYGRVGTPYRALMAVAWNDACRALAPSLDRDSEGLINLQWYHGLLKNLRSFKAALEPQIIDRTKSAPYRAMYSTELRW